MLAWFLFSFADTSSYKICHGTTFWAQRTPLLKRLDNTGNCQVCSLAAAELNMLTFCHGNCLPLPPLSSQKKSHVKLHGKDWKFSFGSMCDTFLNHMTDQIQYLNLLFIFSNYPIRTMNTLQTCYGSCRICALKWLPTVDCVLYYFSFIKIDRIHQFGNHLTTSPPVLLLLQDVKLPILSVLS